MNPIKEDAKINDSEVHPSNEWISREMKGLWDGKGRWDYDGKWRGHGTWSGGLLSGNWDGNGKWDPIDEKLGNWTGNGNIICNLSFYKFIPMALILLFFAVTGIGIVISIFMMHLAKAIGIILALFLIGIFIALKKTNIGKWDAAGTWEDVGDFRILKFQGNWKLGYHKGILNGEMKDPKPSNISSDN